jgi:hypothetical protein
MMDWIYIRTEVAIDNLIHNSEVKCIYKNKEYIFNKDSSYTDKISIGMIKEGKWYAYTYCD